MANEKKSNSSAAVGYGKPPQATRFQKGQSGNPAGRPKGSPNLVTVLEDTLNEQVVVTEQGQRTTMSKLQAAVKQLVNKAATGDPRALQHLLGLKQWVDGRAATPGMPEPVITVEDQTVIEQIIHHVILLQGGQDELPTTAHADASPI